MTDTWVVAVVARQQVVWVGTADITVSLTGWHGVKSPDTFPTPCRISTHVILLNWSRHFCHCYQYTINISAKCFKWLNKPKNTSEIRCLNQPTKYWRSPKLEVSNGEVFPHQSFSMTAVKFPSISRFSHTAVTLHCCICIQWCRMHNKWCGWGRETSVPLPKLHQDQVMLDAGDGTAGSVWNGAGGTGRWWQFRRSVDTASSHASSTRR